MAENKLKTALREVVSAEFAEIPGNEREINHSFSDDFLRRMDKLKHAQRSRFWRMTNTVPKRVAAVSSSGLLTVTNQYQGISGKTTKGEITTYIEKKTWGLFWKRVDIGEPNNEWYDVIYNYVYAGDHTFQLPSKGTYRITVVYVISGSGGAPDTITRTIKKTY